MEQVGTKEELLATLRAERAAWEALLAEVGPARMEEPGPMGDWAFKDLLAHLAAYQRAWGARLRWAATGVPPTTREMFDVDALPAGAETWTTDQQNAAIHDQYASLPPPAVLAMWRETDDRLAEGVAALLEADLTTPGRFPWADHRPLAEAMAGDTYRHAREHAVDVRAWLGRGGAA
jgi:hypothetical protein